MKEEKKRSGAKMGGMWGQLCPREEKPRGRRG